MEVVDSTDSNDVIENGSQLCDMSMMESRPSSSDENVRVNPFEKHILEQLHRPVWSPSVLERPSTESPPPQTEWAIDQISLLYPKKIEESPSTHQNEHVITPTTEAKAQSAIRKFFSHHLISSPKTPNGMVNFINMKRNGFQEEFFGNCESQVESPGSKLVNTDISFPPILPHDVEQLLNSLSSPLDPTFAITSTLKRRKLDFTLSSSPGSEVEPSENMEFSPVFPTPGAIVHSPGCGDLSPKYFRNRDGMDSPRFTPIRIPKGN